MDQLDFIGFTNSVEGLRPSIKHWKQIEKWSEPINKKKLNAFMFFTLFLQIFIPRRAKHVLIMKKTYLEEQPVKLSANLKKTLVQNQWVNTDRFVWGDEEKCLFQAMKEAISTNLMSGANPKMQYYLATDASK